MIIGIDHGYYAIKTRNCSFPAGITPFGDREPYTPPERAHVPAGAFLFAAAGGSRSSGTRPPATTTTLLTLAAIAQELQARGAPARVCSVTIAAGLPLTSYGRGEACLPQIPAPQCGPADRVRLRGQDVPRHD